MHERLNTYAEFLKQPHVEAIDLIRWLDQPDMPQPVPVPALPGIVPPVSGTPVATAPLRGQHTEAVLREHGFDGEEIAQLLAGGTVAGAA
jgi:crotonobetainyl-CoA:carnitine CoA-transferase CaiB-like acyl-CoA transferase